MDGANEVFFECFTDHQDCQSVVLPHDPHERPTFVTRPFAGGVQSMDKDDLADFGR